MISLRGSKALSGADAASEFIVGKKVSAPASEKARDESRGREGTAI